MPPYNPLFPPVGCPYCAVAGFDLPINACKGNVLFLGALKSGKTTLINALKLGLLPYVRAIDFQAKPAELPVLRGIVGADRIANLNVFEENAYALDLAHDLNTPQARTAFTYALIPEIAAAQSHFWDANSRNILKGETESFDEVSKQQLLADARSLVDFAAQHLYPESGGPSWDLRDLIASVNPDYLHRVLERSDYGRRVIANILTHRGTAGDRLQDLMGTLSSWLDRLAPVAQAMRIHAAAGRRFSIRDWAAKRTRQTVIRLALDVDNEEAWNPWLGTLLRQSGRSILSLPVNEDTIEFVLFGDEVQTLGSIYPELPSFMARSRTHGCTSIVATQHFAGVRKAFKEPSAHLELTDICTTHVYLRTDSTEVAHFAEDILGKVTYWRNQPTLSESEAITDNFGVNEGDAFAETETEHPALSRSFERPSPHGPTYTVSRGVQRGEARQRGITTGWHRQRLVEPLFDSSELLNMRPPSPTSGMSCVVRHANLKWGVRMHPEWIRNRTPRPVGVPERPLDPEALRFKTWTPEEAERFVGPEPAMGDFFSGIGGEPTERGTKKTDERTEGLGIRIRLPPRRR